MSPRWSTIAGALAQDVRCASQGCCASSARTQHPTLTELAAWLDEHPGPQRVTLDDLRAQWLRRRHLFGKQATSETQRLWFRMRERWLVKMPDIRDPR